MSRSKKPNTAQQGGIEKKPPVASSPTNASGSGHSDRAAFEIAGNPDVGDVTFHLKEGQSVLAESGAMSRMSTAMEMRASLMGGVVKAVIRKLLGGESLFVGEYTATQDGQLVAFSPSVPGSVIHRQLAGETLMVTAGSFLACTPGITIGTKFGGLKALFSGEGAFLLECGGSGDLFINSYGAVLERDIDGEFIVDTGHVVAWEPSLEYTIGGMGGIKQTLFSGEGLVLRFSGKGRIWLQTRHTGGMAGWLRGYCR